MCWLFWLGIGAPVAAIPDIDLVQEGVATAVIVLPANAESIAVYAAHELAYHVEKASGARLEILNEPLQKALVRPAVYIGATEAARAAGIDPQARASEEAVLRKRPAALRNVIPLPSTEYE